MSPTVAEDGYVLSRLLLPGGLGIAAIGANVDDIWVLRRGNCYVFRMYNWTAGAEVLGFQATWAEEADSPAIDGY